MVLEKVMDRSDYLLVEEFEQTILKIKSQYNKLLPERLDGLKLSDHSKKIFSRVRVNTLKLIDEEIIPFFRMQNDVTSRLRFEYGGRTITKILYDFINSQDFDYYNITNDSAEVFNFDYSHLISIFNEVKKAILQREEADALLFDLRAKVDNVETVRIAYENTRTEAIFSKASREFLFKARVYDTLFGITLIGIFFAGEMVLTQCREMLSASADAVVMNEVRLFFFITKIIAVSIAITLVTVFLRRSSHFRKLYDQAHQSSLELEALPLFINSLDKSVQDEVIKDLVPKYFGKDIDKTQHDKVSDLINEQIKTSMEVFKASADILRSAKTIEKSNSSDFDLMDTKNRNNRAA